MDLFEYRWQWVTWSAGDKKIIGLGEGKFQSYQVWAFISYIHILSLFSTPSIMLAFRICFIDKRMDRYRLSTRSLLRSDAGDWWITITTVSIIGFDVTIHKCNMSAISSATLNVVVWKANADSESSTERHFTKSVCTLLAASYLQMLDFYTWFIDKYINRYISSMRSLLGYDAADRLDTLTKGQ